MLAQAAEHHTQSTGRLEADIAESARIRAEAGSEAEQVRANAIAEAENRIATARKQAAAITARTQQEFSWRKQQLRRETELLQQRKSAVLSQLASLSELAQQTASSFPDLEDDDSDTGTPPRGTAPSGAPAPSFAAAPARAPEQDDHAATEDVPEDGTDRTILKRYPAPSLPADVEPGDDESTLVRPVEVPAENTPEQPGEQPGDQPSQELTEEEPTVPPSSPRAEQGSETHAGSTADGDDLDIPMDGEPTLLAAPDRLPSGPSGTRPPGTNG
jgi:hypothetical protein